MPKNDAKADDGDNTNDTPTVTDDATGCPEGTDRYTCPNWKTIVKPKGFNNQRCTTCKQERRI